MIVESHFDTVDRNGIVCRLRLNDGAFERPWSTNLVVEMYPQCTFTARPVTPSTSWRQVDIELRDSG